jgi:hypothetical protein
LSKSQDADAFTNIYQNQVFMQFLKLLVPNLDQHNTLIFLPDLASGNAILRIFQQTFPSLQVLHQIEEDFACLKAVIETIFANIHLYLPNMYGGGQHGAMQVTASTAYANYGFC